MVRSILDDSKTQTRRVITPQPYLKDIVSLGPSPVWAWDRGKMHVEHQSVNPDTAMKKFMPQYCPYGMSGDMLWVRESHYMFGLWMKNGVSKTGAQKWRFVPIEQKVRYIENLPDILGERPNVGWYKRPSIFMPKWASRITLRIKDVHVERAQDISNEDAIEEGCGGCLYPCERCKPTHYEPDAVKEFGGLWDKINAKRGFGWNTNPWVWKIKFEVVE